MQDVTDLPVNSLINHLNHAPSDYSNEIKSYLLYRTLATFSYYASVHFTVIL